MERSFRDSRWQVEHRCPQCGAPVTLEEGDTLFTCRYCRVRLCFHSPDYRRFIIPPRYGLQETILLVPYWRIRGMTFSCEPHGITCRITDRTFPAIRSSFLPQSLGVRPQALRLEYAAEAPGMRYLGTDISFSEILKTAGEIRHVLLDSEEIRTVFFTAFVGEITSVIYTPVYEKDGKLFDSVLGRSVTKQGQTFGEPISEDREVKPGISILGTLCPECGWELDGQKTGLTFFCRKCRRVWMPSMTGMEHYHCAEIRGNGADLNYFPFWKLRARFEGIILGTYADLIRTANLPRAAQNMDESRILYFWIPAFRAEPSVFIRLSRTLTAQQPFWEEEEDMSDAPHFSVTLPEKEAAKMIPCILADLIMNKRGLYPILSTISAVTAESTLVYVPFDGMGSEFIQPHLQCSVHMNSLKFAGML